MPEPWPDLTGDCPDSWPPNQWVAAQAIHEGETQRVVAARLGVAVGTVSRWKRTWRNRYGDDFLAGDKTRNLEHAREIASTYRDGTNFKKWADVRRAAASANGVTADLSRQLAQQIVVEHLEDPTKRSLLTLADAFTLAKIANMLEKRADELDRAREPFGETSTGEGLDERGVPLGVLDGLDAPIGEEAESVFRMAAENAETFLYLVTDQETRIPPDGVVETTGKRVV